MKKYIFVSVLAAAMLTACGNGQESVPVDATVSNTEVVTESEAKAEITAAAITSAVTAEIEIPSAVEKSIDNIGAFYNTDTSKIADMSVLICGSGAYPDELAAFKFTDSESAKAGAEAVRERLESQTALYKDYTPDEAYKLEDAVIIEKDNWVVLAICSDNARAKEIISGLLQ